MTDDTSNVRKVDFASLRRPSASPVESRPVTLICADQSPHLNKKCSDVRGFSMGTKHLLNVLEHEGIVYVGDLVQLSRETLTALVESQLIGDNRKPLEAAHKISIAANIDNIERTLANMKLQLGMTLSDWERPSSQRQLSRS